MPGAFVWAAEADVSAGYVRPLDDSMSLNDGWAGTLTAGALSPVTDRLAVGPAAVVTASSIPQGTEPIHAFALLAGARGAVALGEGVEATSTLAFGVSRRPMSLGADPEWLGWAERVDLGVRYRFGPLAAGVVVAYERYDGNDRYTLDHFIAGAGVSGALPLGEARPEVPALGRLRLQVGAGAGHAARAAMCPGCTDDGGVALSLTAGVAVADQIDAGVEAFVMGKEWFVGPAARWDFGGVVAATAGVGAGTWDGDDHDGGLVGATGLAGIAGVDVPVWTGEHVGAAVFGRAALIRAQGDLKLALVGVAFTVAGCAR